jgi:hypothetical protein
MRAPRVEVPDCPTGWMAAHIRRYVRQVKSGRDIPAMLVEHG